MTVRIALDAMGGDNAPLPELLGAIEAFRRFGVREAIISPEVFTVVVVLVLLTTLATPLLLRLMFPKMPATSAPRVKRSTSA